MRDKLLGKIVFIVVLSIFLMVATGMIRGLINEREWHQAEAINDIASSLSEWSAASLSANFGCSL